MHVNSLLHVRDHAKVQGTAHHLLAYIKLFKSVESVHGYTRASSSPCSRQRLARR
jgi:hypothetical protein